ncbi:conserved hypothetical protein [delta proteobacterium NaphS2]|nr:conserved hypothetical protein [delta proteobacterium NaphS2]EFK08941.1 conserved hypothetical protein [delta proteobacterium NaphS2]
MNDENREISVESEMLSPINKLEALSQLFDCSADSEQLGKLDISGIIGIRDFLHSISTEILEVSQDLDNRIAREVSV